MALPLPHLDDRSYTDLLELVRSLIPTYAPEWTDHNPSDPGMTLLELFAWLTEMLLYRTNQIPAPHIHTFLKLLNGPQWQPGSDLDADIRQSILTLRQPERAVTCDDYVRLSRAAAPQEISRVYCVPRRNLDTASEAERLAPSPGHMSVVLVPVDVDPTPQPSLALCQMVLTFLEPRRLLTTRHHVTGPVYVPISAEILLARRPDVPEMPLRQDIVDALERFLHPINGGDAEQGWPLGQAVYVSELYALLEALPGVDAVASITLASQCPPQAVHCAEATVLWHDNGDCIGLGLAAHHLPQARITVDSLVITTTFLPVRVVVTVRVTVGLFNDQAAQLRRTVKTTVQQFLHPLHGGPDGSAPRDIDPDEVMQAVNPALRSLLPGGTATVQLLALTGPQSRMRPDEHGQMTRVAVQERELLDVQVSVELTH